MEGARVVKVYPSPDAAKTALDRASALRGAGLHTPAASPLAPATLAFTRLTGRSGAALLADLPTLLAPLAALHRTPLPGLAPHDPFRRITPRLSLAPPALQARIAALATRPMPTSTATLHGDFHPGQVIATEDGTPWLIDLDDMAFGPPEADLGNLLAWLLTSPTARDRAPAGGWRRALLNAWTGHELHPTTLSVQTEIALIRRALKLFAQGEDGPLTRILADGYRAEISDD